MRKHIIILVLTALILSSCSTPANFYFHKPESDGGSIFSSSPESSFFYDKYYSNEITNYKLRLNKEQYNEIKKLIKIIKSKQELSDAELSEGPTDMALIIGKDTIYGYGQSWMWRKRVVFFESPILKKTLEKYIK